MIRSRALAVALVAAGGVSVAVGAGVWEFAAGLVVGGVEAVAAGLLLVDVDVDADAGEPGERS